jgi:ATP-dependent DNA helicase RecQ
MPSLDRDALSAALQQYWGYDSFLPLQKEAMECALARQDSVVVLPTGGGKSLCYQAPAMCLEGLTLVVSPLISLMKDQVDALTGCGIPAACINSTSSPEEKQSAVKAIRTGRLKLLYVAPERLVQPRTLEFLRTAHLAQVAIDEAHCISAWGHDFRPEYRQLRILKQTFPDVGVHAFTATATEQVRRDIAEQLGLSGAKILVGSFDRPNLVYRVRRRSRILGQIREVLDRHKGESGIIYCITRKEVERIADSLADLGYRVRPYHAGLSDSQRQKHQDEFAAETVDTIVATVAFGMGIDKSNVRYVIHAGLPKTLEHYQQETGRAGRDGLEAECWLFHSLKDVLTWTRILSNSTPEVAAAGERALEAMARYAGSAVCRHAAIVEHFGQSLDVENCGACDVCLDEVGLVDEPLILAQKILSCVVRLREWFGAEYTVAVLAGSQEERVMKQRHDELSTWGLLRDQSRRSIRDWIEQLVSQKLLARTGEFQTLRVTELGWRTLRGEYTPKLLAPSEDPDRETAVEVDAWAGVDRGLFEALRTLRREVAADRGVPAYVVFGDAALRDMARRRPTTVEAFLSVHGVGEQKQREFGQIFVGEIVAWSNEQGVEGETE